MYLRNLIGFVFWVYVPITSATRSCEITDEITSCVYTVMCSQIAGTVPVRSGCGENRYITFIVKNSNIRALSAGFFGSTNFDSGVRSIEATNNTWTEILDETFRYYRLVKYMDLSNNNIKFIHSESFRQLHELKSLNLSNNLIEELPPLAFKLVEVQENFETLDLSYNKISALVRNQFAVLPGLKILYLEGNRLKFIDNLAIDNVRQLEFLFLQHNQLDTLNTALINLGKLSKLDVSHNNLTELLVFEVNRLVALRNLNVSHNALKSVDSDCFNKMANLESVDFSYNKISSNIENKMFINNVHLRYINFYDNHITTLSDNSFQFNRLIYINLENNNISGIINNNTLIGFNNITKLDLSRQNIEGIGDKAFSIMSKLINLNMSKNVIQSIANDSFTNSALTVLDLSNNLLKELNFMNQNFVNLTELYLNNNNISKIMENTFGTLESLKKLDLSMNKIVTIEPHALPLNNIQYFNISGNVISGTIVANVFSPAKYLRFLDLSNLNISKIDSMAFRDLPGLARLNLSHNSINSIEANSIYGVENMFSLDISSNKLQSLVLSNTTLQNLKALYLNNNNFRNISMIFNGTCNLIYLDMSNNNISDVSEVGANLLPNITVLRLSNNKIKLFNSPRVNTLATLIDLSLSSNGLTRISLKYFKDLMSVDLSNNSLTYINNTFFENVDRLSGLDLSANKISELPPGTFKNMKNLRLLNLSSNFISNLRFGSLKGLHKTELLDLSRNRLDAIDVDVFFECTELMTLIIDYNYIKSFDVERLITISSRNLKSVSLGGNPISCREIVYIKSRNSPLLEVTALEKVYHEDNVHGITCGNATITTTDIPSNKEETKTGSTSAVVLVWCSIITISLIAVGVVIYLKVLRKNQFLPYNLSPTLSSRSLELSQSEY